MHSQLSFESLQGGRSSQVGWQRVLDSRSNVTKRTSTEGFQVCFWNSLQSFCQRTKGARWLICAERRRQVQQKSAAEVTESEQCELVQSSCQVSDPVYTVQWGARCGTGTVVYAANLFIPSHLPHLSAEPSVQARSSLFSSTNMAYFPKVPTQEERLGGGGWGI